ncbi:MAG: chemotaxis protein CheW [Acidobacteriota bacterium]|nr:chemotaxis protein CheW [Acidobacteriota bacterium]MDH3530289.1 chemotaxis protein CheW [Acidobacteriota bacterium]
MAEQVKEDLFDLDALSEKSISGMSDPFFHEESGVPEDGDKYVVFEIEKQNFAIPSEGVAEVVRMLPLTVIPNVPAWFLGIANLRGDILSVIDLSGLINKKPADQAPKSKLVVLSSADSETNLAFKVDRLREIVVLSDEKIESSDKPSDAHLAGIAQYKSSALNVLNVPAIITSLAVR